MKLIINSLLLILLSSCCETKKEKNNLIISKNNFSVSGFDKKLDSLKNNNSKIGLETVSEINYNENYLNGALHFLIIDENNAYYVITPKKSFVFIYGNENKFSKKDSLNYIEKSKEIINNITQIKTSEITQILKQNRHAILNTENRIPLNISFALKNDSLRGSQMHDIISYMENNGMKSYTIRRMNQYETKKTE
ncbi:hypothetical protein SAMN05421638_2303 [Kaistella treverensis]|uniref:Lipoprotein n=1 Tax=Kaistella treverensis TaxID=631455 RepID=A0A1I3P166_9FLAO|nr:hypothetical protein [Kaistella treverensis]SFJ14776.1 hypothetical protein SAMN05421638_2303 [Kaistella treverensis]